MKTLLAAIILITSTGMALAQTCQTIGGMTYCNSNDGSNYTGQHIGNMDYWNGTQKVPEGYGGTANVPYQKTCQHIGTMTYCN